MAGNFNQSNCGAPCCAGKQCHVDWEAIYDCSSATWTVSQVGTATCPDTCTATDWVQDPENPCRRTKTTCAGNCSVDADCTSPTPPDAPGSATCVCIDKWQALYDCDTSTWTVTHLDTICCPCPDGAGGWVTDPTNCKRATMFTCGDPCTDSSSCTEGTPPSAPTFTPCPCPGVPPLLSSYSVAANYTDSDGLSIPVSVTVNYVSNCNWRHGFDPIPHPFSVSLSYVCGSWTVSIYFNGKFCGPFSTVSRELPIGSYPDGGCSSFGFTATITGVIVS